MGFWSFRPRTEAASASSGGLPSSDPAVEARPTGLPRHVAIIMDGNGRWAKERGLPRIEGHRAGARTVRMVVEESRRLEIPYLTLFSFSTENWLRPQEEVSGLMRLFCEYVRSERELLLRHNIRLRAIGARERLPSDVCAALEDIEGETSHCSAMQLVLALSYGGRDEIVHAVRALVADCLAGKCQPDEIDESSIQRRLFAPDIPDPDVILRTGDECRLSNFLLWQSAYAELVVSGKHWPAFSAQDLSDCLAEFARRTRRFGMTDEQLEQRL